MPGFFKKVGNFFKKAAEVAVTVVAAPVVLVGAAIEYGVNKVKEKLKDKPRNNVYVEDYPTGKGISEPGDDGGKKALLEARENAVTEYQKRIKEKTSKRESQVQEAYMEAYAGIIDTLEKNDVEVLSIRHYMEERKSAFSHTMRDEINTKVSTGYQDWDRIVKQVPESDSDVKRIKKEMDDYTKRVYDKAENHLLDKLSDAFDVTNTHIQKSIDKCLKDKRDALTMMKQNMVELTQDKESRDKRLLRIAQESALMQFVDYEVTRKQ